MSWVSQRLRYAVGTLPDAALAAVLASGHLSSWVANQTIVPVGAPTPEHAEQLPDVLARDALSTRELQCWFEHLPDLRTARERMVNRRAVHRQIAGKPGEHASAYAVPIEAIA